MTDLEITKLCAEAMGYTDMSAHWGGLPLFTKETAIYDPLHDDAQAMALVKKFRLCASGIDAWTVMEPTGFQTPYENEVKNADLNRAICECVAKMQKSK